MNKMFQVIKGGKLKSVASLAVVTAGLTASSAFAQAAPIDVSSVTTLLTAVGVAVATIGLAVLAVVYGAKAYKWIRSAG